MSEPALTSAVAWSVDLADEAATRAFAEEVADLVASGDLVTLSGDLGSGKTTFARALVRRVTGDATLEVPSPTFTLMQVYEGPSFPVVHADLYRIRSPNELEELGWDEAAQGALVLVEWAERAVGELSGDRLDVRFEHDLAQGPEFRRATLSGLGPFAQRVARARATHRLLDEAGFATATRAAMVGDASIRAYERLTKPDGASAVLMIAPPRAPGPPLRFGKPYHAIAKLSDSIIAWLAVDAALRARGLSAPKVLGADVETGLALIEDFGIEAIADHDGPVAERYAEAASLLADLHAGPMPAVLPLGGEATYPLPPYDLDALLIEVELMLDWYAPHVARITPASGPRAVFLSLWRHALESIAQDRSAWVLRDYHSANLMWLPERDGVARVGLIDFQDCVMGHPAYDVVSLLQDARQTVPAELELHLLGLYARRRRAADPRFDMAGFAAAYALLGAQRATKILGIFVRLDRRDHKPHYVQHLPHIERYLVRCLRHPALAEIKTWYETHLPQALSGA